MIPFGFALIVLAATAFGLYVWAAIYREHARKLWEAYAGKRGDPTDISVYSNHAYWIAPAAVSLTDPLAFGLLVPTGVALCIASGVYHATYERWAQRWDIAAMMTYVAALFSVVASIWVWWAPVIVPVVAYAYGKYTWQINSFYHVPPWAVAIIGLLWVHAGTIALAAAVPVSVGVAIDRLIGDGESDKWPHVAWHLGGALSVAFVLHLI